MFTCWATVTRSRSFVSAANAKSARVNIAPPITPPKAFLCRAQRVRLVTAWVSSSSSSVMPFSVANLSHEK